MIDRADVALKTKIAKKNKKQKKTKSQKNMNCLIIRRVIALTHGTIQPHLYRSTLALLMPRYKGIVASQRYPYAADRLFY